MSAASYWRADRSVHRTKGASTSVAPATAAGTWRWCEAAFSDCAHTVAPANAVAAESATKVPEKTASWAAMPVDRAISPKQSSE